MEVKVLDSLHRPFHRPLWIVKWVCYYFSLKQKNRRGYLYSTDKTTDFYFTLLGWLHADYPQDGDGVPSKESVEEVWSFFSELNIGEREARLREVLAKKREKGVETKIYSTYKAASYYLNLANDKLRFVNACGLMSDWAPSQLTKAVLKSKISPKDRNVYFRHILQNDCHFFISMCLLQKLTLRYGLSVEEEIYKFMQKYYPVVNFDYTKHSHSNYYVVRRRWIELLRAVNKKGVLSPAIRICLKEDGFLNEVYQSVVVNVKEYTNDIRNKSIFIRQKKAFVDVYQEQSKKNEDKSGFVNLYDISKEMKMGYNRFQVFLSQFYQEERMVRNIFFINIVSTIDQRKRFYIGNSPVLKIKMTKNYGV